MNTENTNWGQSVTGVVSGWWYVFGEEGRAECTVDGTHPNSLGFMRMAEKIYPIVKEALEE